jgi:Domain of unknown function (4846)
MRSAGIPLSLLIICACGSSTVENTAPVATVSAPVDTFYATIGEIRLPNGFVRIAADSGSFAAWLRKVPLKRSKEVRLYNGDLKYNQAAQFAVVEIPVGDKDLQQCADVAMRFRAEYLFSLKRYSEIRFADYSGKWYIWQGQDNRLAFERYLQQVFGWCGSASLEKQLKPVKVFSDIQPGDVLIQGGFPGHAITVVDMAVDANGKKIFMLAQGYQPAQDIHVLRNFDSETLSPWYKVNGDGDILTPEWVFRRDQLRRW